MKIKISAGFAIAFVALRFIMHDLHELVHTSIGRIICGGWGQRDFNTWSLCEGCIEKNHWAVLATFSGPLFTYMAIWTGVYLLLQKKDHPMKSAGFALIFANNPFARIFTAAMGKGDEVFGLKTFLRNTSLAWICGLLIVLLFTICPLYASFITITNKKRAIYFIIFLLFPMLLDSVLIFGVMDPLLNANVLSNYWILGSQVLVTVVTLFFLVILLLTRKQLLRLWHEEVSVVTL